MNCKCYVYVDTDPKKTRIVHCPLHEAAPTMLEALKLSLSAIHSCPYAEKNPIVTASAARFGAPSPRRSGHFSATSRKEPKPMETVEALYIVLNLAKRGAKAPTRDVAAIYSEQYRREQEAIRIIVEGLTHADATKS
jgi:hypothetical protein